MEKVKTFKEARFSVDVLSNAAQIVQQVSEDHGQNDLSTRFKIEQREAKWTYDSLEEFLAEYPHCSGNAYFTIYNIAVGITLHIRARETELEVSAPTRIEIEKVFEIFESAVEACSLPSDELIKKKQDLKIEGKIIDREDVQNLAAHVANIFPKSDSTSISFSAECQDGPEICSESVKVFEEGLINNKRIQKIEMSLYGYSSEPEIRIKISHGGDEFENYVSVSGTDSRWVDHTLQSIKDIIEGFKPQNMVLYSYRVWIYLFLALGLGIILLGMLTLLPHDDLSKSQGTEGPIVLSIRDYLWKYLAAFGLGIGPALILYSKLTSLFPSVELRIGPEHMYFEKLRREWIMFFIFSVIPIVALLTESILT